MSIRSRSRELALQLLFEKEFQSQGSTPGPSQELIQHAQEITQKQISMKDKDVAPYALILFQGTVEHLDAIDQMISASSTNWKIGRMSLVDKNILRLAVFEMIHVIPEVPVASVIDEAVELAKKFGTTESKAFVNGVLDQVARSQNKIEVDESTRTNSLKSS